MQTIIFLTKILHELNPDNVIATQDNTLYSKLYHSIISDKIQNQQEAISLLYGFKSNSKNFYTLKSRYKQLVFDKVLESNLNKLMNKKHFNAKYKIVKSQLLVLLAQITLKSNNELNEVIKTALNLALKFEDVSLTVYLSSKLQFSHKVVSGNKAESVKYKKLFNRYKTFLDETFAAHTTYTYFASLVSSRKAYIKTEIEPKEISVLRKLEQRLHTNHTYYFNFYILSSLYYYYLITEEKFKIVEVCNYAISLFKSKEQIDAHGIFSFYVKLGFFFVLDNKYNQAEVKFLEAEKISPIKGLSAWLNLKNHQVSNYIISKKYKKAHATIQEILQLKNFNDIPFLYREPALIKAAYLNLLQKMGKYKSETKPGGHFRIHKFLNEVPVYSKDKRGTNIAILIIHVLFLFLNKKYDQILNRLEALKSYSFRYLRNDETLRSNAFIKILLQLPRADYHPTRLKRYAQKYYDRLLEAPKHFGLLSLDVEIIPYEQLWELVLEMLDLRLASKI